MKEKHLMKRIGYALLAIVFFICTYIVCIPPRPAKVKADEVSVASDTAIDVADLYISSPSESIYNNIAPNQYYNKALTNNAHILGLDSKYYTFSAGANILNDSLDYLVYRLELTDVNADDMSCDFYFHLFKCLEDGKGAEKVLTIKIEQSFYDGFLTSVVGIKRNKFCSEKIGISNYEKNVTKNAEGKYVFEAFGDTLSGSLVGASFCQDMVDDGFEVVHCNHVAYDGTNGAHLKMYGDINRYIYVMVQPDSAFSTYFVRSAFSSVLTLTSMETSIAGIYDVCYDMDKREDLSYLSETTQSDVKALVDTGDVKEVQVAYLERIGKTPFAKKVYKYVDIPVVDSKIEPKDVAAALGINTLSCGESPCTSFTYDEESGIYTAYYNKNVWLSSKDANGKSVNYFLDINLSYKDYYKEMVDDGIFTQGMYEWFWSTMIVKYPDIADVSDDNLYGYFGYTVVPYTYSLNQLMYEMFDGSPNMDGVCRYFSYRDDLAYESYNKLLDEYGYNWIRKGWNAVAGFLAGSVYPADHYFFYVDGEQDNAFIGNNGAENAYDNDGYIKNQVDNAVNSIKEAFQGIFDNDWAKPIFYVFGALLIIWVVTWILGRFYKVRTAAQKSRNAKYELSNVNNHCCYTNNTVHPRKKKTTKKHKGRKKK